MEPIKIVVVEDELIIGRDITQALKKFGHQVIANVGSGEETLQVLQKSLVDLVILDINIKGSKNGIEIARIIRDQYKIPVIFLTALSDSETVEKAKCVEPYGYIIKPFNDNDLRVAVDMGMYKYVKDQELYNNQFVLTKAFSYLSEAVITIKDDYSVELMNETAIQLCGRQVGQKKEKNYLFEILEFYKLSREKVSFASLFIKDRDMGEEPLICNFLAVNEERTLTVKCQRVVEKKEVIGWVLLLSNAQSDQKDNKGSISHLPLNLSASTPISCIFARKGKKYVRISLEDILWLESKDNWVIIYTIAEEFVVYITLKELESRLPESDFLKIHRSFIVRLDKIRYCEDNYVAVGEKVLPLSRAFKKALRHKILFA
jgi:DNA-binding LytR/AlgR family response regulator